MNPTRTDVGVFGEAATERWENAHGREPDTEYATRFGRRLGPVQPAFEGYVPSGDELT